MYATILLLAALNPASVDQASPPQPPSGNPPPTQTAPPAPGPTGAVKANPPRRPGAAPPAAPGGSCAVRRERRPGLSGPHPSGHLDKGYATVQLNLLPGTGRQDIRAGLLVSTQSPDYRTVPDLNVLTDFTVTQAAVRPIDVEVGAGPSAR